MVTRTCAENAITAIDGGVRVVVHAKPKSGKDAVVEGNDGALVVRVRAVAEDGKATAAVVDVVAAAFGVRAKDVVVARGATARHKELHVMGITRAQAIARVAEP